MVMVCTLLSTQTTRHIQPIPHQMLQAIVGSTSARCWWGTQQLAINRWESCLRGKVQLCLIQWQIMSTPLECMSSSMIPRHIQSTWSPSSELVPLYSRFMDCNLLMVHLSFKTCMLEQDDVTLSALTCNPTQGYLNYILVHTCLKFHLSLRYYWPKMQVWRYWMLEINHVTSLWDMGCTWLRLYIYICIVHCVHARWTIAPQGKAVFLMEFDQVQFPCCVWLCCVLCKKS